MHAIIVDCLMPLVNCSRATHDYAAAIRYLQQLLAALEIIIGCHSVEVVLLLEIIFRCFLGCAELLGQLAAPDVVVGWSTVPVCCMPLPRMLLCCMEGQARCARQAGSAPGSDAVYDKVFCGAFCSLGTCTASWGSCTSRGRPRCQQPCKRAARSR